MAKLFANSGDPDQTPCSVASDLGLHCLSITLLRVSRLHWVKIKLKQRHDKTNTCASSNDSDQPGHPPNLINLRCAHSG